MSRRRPRYGECKTLPDFERGGFAQAVGPTAETGFRSYGAGRTFLPAATNVIPDPQGVLADGTFWPASTANTDITAGVAPPLPLPAELSPLTTCLRMVNDGTADTPATATVAVTASKDHYARFWVYAPTLGGHLHATVENGHTFALANVTAANTDWTAYSVKCATVAGEVTAHIHLAFDGGTASTVYITGAQLVQETIRSPFFCGLYPGCAWTSTANASSSTRATALLRYPITANGSRLCPDAAGGFAVRYTPLVAAEGSEYRLLLYLCNSAGTSYSLQIRWHYDKKFQLMGFDGTNTATISSAVQTYAAGTSHILIGRYTQGGAGTLDLNIDGTDIAQVTQTATLAMGTYIGLGQSLVYGDMGPLLTFCTRPSDALVSSLASADWSNTIGLSKLLSAGDSIVPLGGDSLGYVKVSP